MQLESLRHDLDKAVAEERFEDAARFRDAIISLEKGTANPAPTQPAAGPPDSQP